MKANLIKIIVLFLISLSLSDSLHAQANIDSLKNQLQANIHDTTKVNVLYELAKHFARNDLDKSIEYAHQLITISEGINSTSKVAESYILMGQAYTTKGIAIDTIIQTFEKGLDIANRDNNIRTKVNALSNMAGAYQQVGQSAKALDLYQQVLKIARKEDLKRALVVCLVNMGDLLRMQKSDENILGYYMESLKYAKELDHQRFIAAINNNIAIYYDDKKQIDSALIHYNIALDIKRKIKDDFGTAITLTNIGDLYSKQENYQKANIFLKEGYDLAKKIDYPYAIGLNLFYSSDSYFKQKKYQQSINYIKEGLQIIGTDGDIFIKSSYYKLLNQNYEALGNYKEAYKYVNLFNHLDDSIYNANKDSEMKSLEIKFDVAQKAAENQQLKADTKIAQTTAKNRTFLAIALILALGLAMTWGMMIYKANQRKKELNKILESQVNERTAELQISNKQLEQANYELRTFNYIASHDIKEPIRVIGGYVGLIKRKLPNDLKENLGEYFDTIKRSTAQLYTLIEDFTSYTTMSKNEKIETKTVDLNLLVSNVADNIQETIKKQNGQVDCIDLPTIQSSNALLFTTMKNLIENGLKYNKSEKPTVTVRYHKTETHHKIMVSDNGIGIEKQYHDKIFEMFKRLHNRGEYQGSGIGLAIVKLSVEKLGGTIKLTSHEGKGSRFVIELPN